MGNLKLTKKGASANISAELEEKQADASGSIIKGASKKTTLKNETVTEIDTPASASDNGSKQCEVGFTVGATRNVGDYNSIRYSVSLMVPCNHDELDDVFNFAKDWAESRMNDCIAETMSAMED